MMEKCYGTHANFALADGPVTSFYVLHEDTGRRVVRTFCPACVEHLEQYKAVGPYIMLRQPLGESKK